MIPLKVKEHLEEYINQEVYVQIAIIKGKEKIGTNSAITRYFKSNHFKDLCEGKPFDHFIEGLKNKCLGKLKNSPMRNKQTTDETILDFCRNYEKLCQQKYPEAPLPLEILKSTN